VRRIAVINLPGQGLLETLVHLRLSRDQKSDQIALLGGWQLGGLVFELRQ